MFFYFICSCLILSLASAENCHSYRSLFGNYEPSQYCGSFATCCGNCYARYCCNIGNTFILDQSVCQNDWIYVPVSTIVGSIVGCIIFVIAVIVIIVICRRRRLVILRRPGVVIIPPTTNPNYFNGGYIPPRAYPAPSIPNTIPSQVPHAYPAPSYQNIPPSYTK